MAYRAVDRHIMMGGRGFRVEQLKIPDFRFPIPCPSNPSMHVGSMYGEDALHYIKSFSKMKSKVNHVC